MLHFEMNMLIEDLYDDYMNFHRCRVELKENPSISNWHQKYAKIKFCCLVFCWCCSCCCCHLPEWMCFFWRALEFWNQTCVTRLLNPVTEAMRSRSWPSGFESIWKFACNTCNCSSVKVVRTRFALLLWYPSVSHPSNFVFCFLK